MKKLNFEEIHKASLHLAKRFPEALVSLFLITLWILLYVWDKVYVYSEYIQPKEGVWLKLTEIHFGTILYYLSIATVLSIVLRFWGEEVKNKRLVWVVSLVSHLALLADAIFLWFRPEGSIYSELLLAHASFCTALLIAGIFMPFYREKNDLAAWNLALRMAKYTLLFPLVCGIVTLGLTLLLASLNWLFGIEIHSHWFSTLRVLFLITVPVILWMMRLPEGAEKLNRETLTSKFLNGMVRYMFLPLVAGYLVVLYGYGAKILLDMELPNGGVCVLVVVLMAGCLAIELLLYPLMCKIEGEETKRQPFEARMLRWLPIIILPLLLLMTVAISRRLYDYSITTDRLYILTLNLWFYAVCIGLFISRAKRIHWIFISFGSLFLLTSALPVNFCSITYKVINARVERFFAEHQHPDLPLNEKTFKSFKEQLPKQEAEQIREDLYYLTQLYSHREIAQFVEKDVSLWQEYVIEAKNFEYSYSLGDNIYFDVPEGYTHFRHVSEYNTVNVNDSTLWHIQLNDSLLFAIDIENLPDETDSTKLWLLPELNGQGVLSVTSLKISDSWSDSIQSDFSIRGYHFKK